MKNPITLFTFLLFFSCAFPVLAQDSPTFERHLVAEPFPGKTSQFLLGPSGKWAATLGRDARFILLDVDTGRAIIKKKKIGYQPRLASSPDGKRIALYFWPDRVRVFDTKSGKEISGFRYLKIGQGSRAARLFTEPRGTAVLCLSRPDTVPVSTDGKFQVPPHVSGADWWLFSSGRQEVAIATSSGIVGGQIPANSRKDSITVKIFDLLTGAERASWTYNEQVVDETPYLSDRIAFNVDRAALIRSGKVIVSDFHTGAKKATFGSKVTVLSHHPDGGWLTGHSNGEVKWWSMGRATTLAESGMGPVRRLLVGAKVILVESKSYVRVIGKEGVVTRIKGTNITTFDGHRFTLNTTRGLEVWDGVMFRHKIPGRFGRAGGERFGTIENGFMVIRSLGTKTIVARLGGHWAPIDQMEWQKDHLVVRSKRSKIRTTRLDPVTGKESKAGPKSGSRVTIRRYGRYGSQVDVDGKSIARYLNKTVDSAVLAPSGGLVALSVGLKLHLVDKTGTRRLEVKAGPAAEWDGGQPFGFTPDGKFLVAVSHNGTTSVINLDDVRVVRTFKLPVGGHYVSVFMSPNRPVMGVHFRYAKKLLLVDLQQIGEKGSVVEIPTRGHGRRMVDFHSDGKIVVVGATGLEWYSADTFKKLGEIPDVPAEGISLSSDNRWLAVAHYSTVTFYKRVN